VSKRLRTIAIDETTRFSRGTCAHASRFRFIMYPSVSASRQIVLCTRCLFLVFLPHTLFCTVDRFGRRKHAYWRTTTKTKHRSARRRGPARRSTTSDGGARGFGKSRAEDGNSRAYVMQIDFLPRFVTRPRRACARHYDLDIAKILPRSKAIGARSVGISRRRRFHRIAFWKIRRSSSSAGLPWFSVWRLPFVPSCTIIVVEL